MSGKEDHMGWTDGLVDAEAASRAGGDPSAQDKRRSRRGGGKQDHHFIPQFYLGRWAVGQQKRLCEFSEKHHAIRPRWTSPVGTGYVELLYGLSGSSEEQTQRLEADFYKPVDTRAADALATLEEGGVALAPRLRQGWARFLMSLLMRMPADMRTLSRSYRREFARLTPDQKRRWAAIRRPEWPADLSEAIKQLTPQQAADHAKELATRLMGNTRITDALMAMEWDVMDLSSTRHPLLTSDRPLKLTGMLRDPQTELSLPIGPRRIFIAAYDRRRLEAIASRDPEQLASLSNRTVVRSADEYVWATDAGSLEFIQRQFGRERPVSHLEQLADYIRRRRPGSSRR